jgi:uncharacterized protein
MSLLVSKYGPWALVTGASSGFGAEFCTQLAEEGFNLVMAARREDRLKELAEILETRNSIQTRVVQADLSNLDFLPRLLEAVNDLEIGLLVNNAGFASIRSFLDSDLKCEIEMLHVNCRAQMALAHAFGQKMRARKRGGIIFVSSIAGISYSPPWSSYAASKAYILALAESLWLELKPQGVDVEVVCPGRADTEFIALAGINMKRASWLARFFLTGILPADMVCDSLKRLGKKRVVVPGLINKLAALGGTYLPRGLIMRITAAIMTSVQLEQEQRGKK